MFHVYFFSLKMINFILYIPVLQPNIWILYDDFCVTYFFYFLLVLSSYLSYFYLVCAKCYVIPLLF